jgi:hypothetical protein
MFILIMAMIRHAFAAIKTWNFQNEYLNLSLGWNLYEAAPEKKTPGREGRDFPPRANVPLRSGS